MTILNKVQIGRWMKEFPGGTFNGLIDAVVKFERSGQVAPGPLPQHVVDHNVTVHVLNDTGDHLPRNAVIGLGDPIATPDTFDGVSGKQPTLKAETPDIDEHATRFAILPHPVREGGGGQATKIGFAWVQIEVADENHGFAKLRDGDSTKLDSAGSGPAEIYCIESGTGTKWALVLLGGGGSGGGGETVTVLIDYPIAAGVTAPPQDGVLTTRTDDDTGDVTIPGVDPEVATIEGEKVDLFWGEGWRNSRLGMSVTDVTGAVITLDGGTGDVLPATSTDVRIGPYRLRPTVVGLKVFELVEGSRRVVRDSDLTGTLSDDNPPTDGIIEMDSADHGLLVGEQIFLFWTITGTDYSASARVTEVDGVDVTFHYDEDGDDIPAPGMEYIITHYKTEQVAIYWGQAIDPGVGRAIIAEATSDSTYGLKVLDWDCARSIVFSHPRLPPPPEE